MKPNPFINRVCHSLILRLAVLLVVLAWSSHAFCGEIHDAAKAGDLVKVKALLNANPDLVNNNDTNGWTPLELAAANNREDVVKLLLASKADVNAQDNVGLTPLHCAVNNGYTNVVVVLLANKADINVRAKNGQTPLHLASSQNRKDMVELLLTNKADSKATDRLGYTPLHFVRSKSVAELLLANGSDVNAKNQSGDTPLHCVIDYVHFNREFLRPTPQDETNFANLMDLLRQHGGTNNLNSNTNRQSVPNTNWREGGPF